MRSKSFWWGVGVAGGVLLWRKQLRPLAVKGAKGGLLMMEGIKETYRAFGNAFIDLKQDAQMERIRQELKSTRSETGSVKEGKD